MIENEQQYKVTKTQLEKFKKVIDNFDLKKTSNFVQSKVIAQAELDALKSEHEILTEQITEYESK